MRVEWREGPAAYVEETGKECGTYIVTVQMIVREAVWSCFTVRFGVSRLFSGLVEQGTCHLGV